MLPVAYMIPTQNLQTYRRQQYICLYTRKWCRRQCAIVVDYGTAGPLLWQGTAFKVVPYFSSLKTRDKQLGLGVSSEFNFLDETRLKMRGKNYNKYQKSYP
jgi:hypothetical protein